MDETPPVLPVDHGSRRWWIHLVVLAVYPVVLGVLGFVMAGETDDPMLPGGRMALLATCGVEVLIFGVIFAVAVLISRAGASQLLLYWRDGAGPLWRGFLYSLALRLGVMLVTLLIALGAFIVTGGSTTAIKQLRPEVENIIDAKALSDPVYLFLSVTLVSFVVAGLREELWRAGMLAALEALSPWLFHSVGGRLAAVAMVAVVFGIGHLTQGLGGVLMTTALGFGLGWIMMRHRSIWDAVLAHGFFNATTFLLLYALTR